ncbi:MAG: TRAP transporter large permease [Alphaproteobacteria bacterium]|nr:MAG: TRAP transporter large permease [Alphaproteobacteria bacterium]
MDPLILGLLGIAGMFVLIALHVPIGVAMGLAGFVGVGLLVGWGPAIALFGIEPSGIVSHDALAVIPLFLLMGSFAGAAGLSADLYRLAYALVGHRRGGLAMSTIGACAGFGAVCGSSVATCATMTRVALPEMLKRGYEPALATGCIAAGGTLGMLIPPSVIMVLYAVLTEQFVIALFVAAIVPGAVAVALHFVAIFVYVRVNPEAGPAGKRMPRPERRRVFIDSWAVLLLGVVVSGGIYTGVLTVAEAASAGAIMAFGFTVMRGKLTKKVLWKVLSESAANTGLIYLIIIGAHIFAYFIALSDMAEQMVSTIQSLGLHPLVVMFLLHLMYLILGAIFDTVAAMVITLPFVFPLIIALGFDPIWFGVINVMVIEIGMITPPIGINVFVLHGIARTIPLHTIFRGIVPFLAADLVRLSILTFLPGLALWLPGVMGMLE